MSEAAKELPLGFNCAPCGKEHRFSPYVHAHWNESLTHTCDCGQKSRVRSGIVKPIPTPSTKGDRTP